MTKPTNADWQPGNCLHIPASPNCGAADCAGEQDPHPRLPDWFHFPPCALEPPWPYYSHDQLVDAYWEGVRNGCRAGRQSF